MKNYRITVNGTAYDVAVEEIGAGQVAAAPAIAAPVAPVAIAAAPVQKAIAAPVAQGGVVISAPMPGKILSVKASAGQAVKKGEVILVLEAMKMENEVVAPEDGTVAGVNVAVGDMVEAGNTLATLN